MVEAPNNPGTGNARAEIPLGEAPAAFLSTLFETLAISRTPTELASRAAPAVIDTTGDSCAIWLSDRGSGAMKLAAVAHRDPSKHQLVQPCCDVWSVLDDPASPDWVALLNGTVLLDLADEHRSAQLLGSPERALWAREVGIHHMLLAPLVADSHRLGVLMVGSEVDSCPFDASTINTVGGMARAVAAALAPLQGLDDARQAAQQLTLSGLRFQAVLEAIPQGVLVADSPDGRIASTNRSFVKLVGHRAEPSAHVSSYPEHLGLSKKCGGQLRAEEIPWVHCAMTGEPSASEEMLIHRSDGQDLTVLCSASPIMDEGGKAVGAVALLHDISARKELELQKDEFLAMVAHELKTPLTAIKGYVQLMMRQAQKDPNATIGEREVGMLQVTDRQVTRLRQLVFDLLDCSSIQLGRLVLRLSVFDLGRLARDVVDQMQIANPDRLFHLQVSGDTVGEADALRMEQVLTNLIGNAVKATEAGGRIVVSIQRDGSSVLASVRDDGMGISMDLQKRVFERLFRGPAHLYEGMGLGLYISRGIMDAHGGCIWLESKVGEGSTFFVSLPAMNR